MRPAARARHSRPAWRHRPAIPAPDARHPCSTPPPECAERPGAVRRHHLRHRAIGQVLAQAVAQGGSTLKDFIAVNGQSGYFQQTYFVYDRAGVPCRQCGSPIRQIKQAAYDNGTLVAPSAYTVTNVGVSTGGNVVFSVAPTVGHTILLISDAAYDALKAIYERDRIIWAAAHAQCRYDGAQGLRMLAHHHGIKP